MNILFGPRLDKQSLAASSPPAVRSPTAALQEALNDFANCLCDEERTQFQASTANPDAISVVLFIGEIDAANQSSRKSAASRLSAFLNSIQQFTGAVDSFVSSNPSIAGLVWGSVKMTLIAAQNMSSLFDKVTALTLAIGRQCPTFAQFGHLYKDSLEVQTALCEYYATIVRICTTIIRIRHKSGVSLVMSAFTSTFDADLKPLQTELERAMQQVNLQIMLASQQASQQSQQLLIHEHNQGKLHRTTVSRFLSGAQQEAGRWRLAVEKREAVITRNKILDNLSRIDGIKVWSKIQSRRMTNTAEWFQGEVGYTAWQTHSSSPCTLWCTGPLGVGKTVLVSSIILHLSKGLGANTRLAHHFCRGEEDDSTTARNIIGSLARQLLIQHIHRLDLADLRQLEQQTRSLEPEQMVRLLCQYLDPANIYYLVIDGIDECGLSEVCTLSTSLDTLRSHLGASCKILLSSRREVFSELFRIQAPEYTLSVSKDRVKADNEAYIRAELAQKFEMRLLNIVDPLKLIEIADVLERDCDGMFLWLTLFIEELCAKQRQDEILDALEHPPKKLSELFDLKLTRVRAHLNGPDAMLLLKYCGASRRPFTIDEIRELLGITPLQESLDPRKFPQKVHQIIVSCCGLLRIDEDDNSVHYAHHSIKTHLFSTKELVGAGFVHRDIDLHLGAICLTYLNFNDFQRQLTRTTEENGPNISAMDLALSSVMPSSPFTKGLATKLMDLWGLRAQIAPEEFRRMLYDVACDGRRRPEQYFFLDYAKRFWVWHTSQLDEDYLPGMWRLFESCVQSNTMDLERPWIHEPLQGDIAEELKVINEWALSNSHDALLLYALLNLNEWKTDTNYDLIRSTLHHLISDQGHLTDRAILLTSNYDRAFLRDSLHYGAKEGNETAVIKALQLRVDENAPDCNGLTALHLAASQGHRSICAHLLKLTRKPRTLDWKQMTAIQLAILNGHESTVEIFYECHDDSTNLDADICVALSSGNLNMIETLLNKSSANVRVPKKRGTGLCLAASMGQTSIVKLLLRHGYHVNSSDSQYHIPIQLAASHGYVDTVKALITAGADVNACRNSSPRTALHYAASNGKEKLTPSLPYHPPKVRPEGLVASLRDYPQTVKVLLAAGAKTWEGFWETSPLSIAIHEEAYEVMEHLAVAGVKYEEGQASVVMGLLTAIDSCAIPSLSVLRDAGARFDIHDSEGRYLLCRAVDKYLRSTQVTLESVKILHLAGASLGDHHQLRVPVANFLPTLSRCRTHLYPLLKVFLTKDFSDDDGRIGRDLERDVAALGCPGLARHFDLVKSRKN